MELINFIWKLFVNLLTAAGHAVGAAVKPLLTSRNPLLSVPRMIGMFVAACILGAVEMFVSLLRVARSGGPGGGRFETKSVGPVVMPVTPRFRFNEQTRHRLGLAGALVVIVGTYGWLLVWGSWTMFGRSNADLKTAAAVGQVAADEAANLTRDQGVVVVVGWQSGRFTGRLPEERARINAFCRYLRVRPRMRLAGIERIDPGNVDWATGRLNGVFGNLLRKYPNANVVVSFVGIPDLNDEEIARAGNKLPQFVVLTNMRSGLQKFMDRDLVTVAIVPRREPCDHDHDHDEGAQTLYERFEHAYEILRHPKATAQATR